MVLLSTIFLCFFFVCVFCSYKIDVKKISIHNTYISLTKYINKVQKVKSNGRIVITIS